MDIAMFKVEAITPSIGAEISGVSLNNDLNSADTLGIVTETIAANQEGFIIRNSWGALWADNGHTIYPYKDFGAHYEIWTSIDDKSSQPVIGARTPKRTKEDREGILKKFIAIFKNKSK